MVNFQLNVCIIIYMLIIFIVKQGDELIDIVY